MFIDLSEFLILNEKEEDKAEDTATEEPVEEEPDTTSDDAGMDDINSEDNSDTNTEDDSDLDNPMDDESDTDDDFGMDDDASTDDSTGDDTDTNTDGESSPEETEENKPNEVLKNKQITVNYIKLYKILLVVIDDLRSIPSASDEEKEYIESSIEDMEKVRDTMFDYITNSLKINTYPVNVYNLYQFKQAMIVSSEIIQKIKEFKEET